MKLIQSSFKFVLFLVAFMALPMTGFARNMIETDNPANRALIQAYYDSYEVGDFQTMQSTYATNVVFKDPVFGAVRGLRAHAMLHMLNVTAGRYPGYDRNLRYTLTNFKVTDTTGSVDWVATYNFKMDPQDPTEKVKVIVNSGTANFKFVNGEIVSHADKFILEDWMDQALELPFYLRNPIGYAIAKRKLRRSINDRLDAFIHAFPVYKQ